MKTRLKISPVHSVRLRVLMLVATLMVVTISLLLRYTLQQFEAATTFELEQEGILLSNALEAAIIPLAETANISGLQTHIDRLVAIRDRHDIEINIMLLEGDQSAVVASNVPDNIEETSPEEHTNLVASLNERRSVVFIEYDVIDEEDDDSSEPTPAQVQPDFYPANSQRFLNITTPLIANEHGLGSINVKLSLARLDQELTAIRWTLLAAGLVALLLVMGGLVLLLNGQIFNPLQRMAEKMQYIAAGDLSQRIAQPGPLNEISWVAHTFDRMIDKLQTAFNREKQFTADISHELRTPLTALKGLISLTLTRPRTPAEHERTLKKLEKEVDRLARLSNDLLFLARLEQGQLRPHLEAQDFSNLLGAIVDQMQPLAKEKGITLDEQIPPGLTLEGDADHLIRLFINIIDNAIKYTPSGGQVKVWAERQGQAIVTTIADTGPGIPPEHLALLFDRFYRVEADRSRTSGGAGLGLAIAHEIARAHQGTIEVESILGQGSTFAVQLPASRLG
jgi:heavy metal sensor kinase